MLIACSHLSTWGLFLFQALSVVVIVTQSCRTLCNTIDRSTSGSPWSSHSPRVCSNSFPLSWWCYLTIATSATLFFCLQSFPESFVMSWLFTSSGQSIGASASASVLPMNIQDWFPLGRTGWISLQSKGLSRVFSSTSSSVFSFLHSPTLTTYMTTEKTIALTRQIFVGKIMSLLFNMLSMLVIAFLPRSKCLLISWLQSPYLQWFWNPRK